MQLEFECTQKVTDANNPGAIHFEDNTAKAFYTSNGILYTIQTNTPYGAWDNRTFTAPVRAVADKNIDYLTLRKISRYGAYGTWKSDNKHRFAIYGVEFDVSDYIEDGSIELFIDNPIANTSISLNNPSQTFMNEDFSIVSPGSKVKFAFRAGDSEPYQMGTFYVDRGGFIVNSENIDISGRNTIGKLLKDQTFDGKNNYPRRNFNQFLREILILAGIPEEKIFIDNSIVERGMKFPPNMTLLDGINELLKTVRMWKVGELVDGSIAIGPINYAKFDQPSKYTFYRNKDIWSRSIIRDDMDTYRRVCVHTDNFATTVYKPVTGFEGWNLGAQKTLYVSVADATSVQECTEYAEELATRVSMVGVIESFVGPFRPHIQPGDEAEIVNEEGSARLLGLITNVRHHFGKQGVATEFTVDSGGKMGKGRISDFIEKINKKKSVSNATRLY